MGGGPHGSRGDLGGWCIIRMLVAEMLNVFWLGLKFRAVCPAMPYTPMLVLVIDPFVSLSIQPVRVWAILVCALIGLQIVDLVNAAADWLATEGWFVGQMETAIYVPPCIAIEIGRRT